MEKDQIAENTQTQEADKQKQEVQDQTNPTKTNKKRRAFPAISSADLKFYIDPADEIRLTQKVALERIDATSKAQLPLGRELQPGVYPPRPTIEHRLQRGGECLLESLQRTLNAIGVNIPPDTVLQTAIENNLYDEKELKPIENPEIKYFTLETLQKMIGFLGFDQSVALTDGRPDIMAKIYDLLKKPSYTGELDERTRLLAHKVNYWIDTLNQGKAFILAIRSEKLKQYQGSTKGIGISDAGDKNVGHAIAVTGYTVDEQKQITFTVYDSGYERTLHLGPKHLAESQENGGMYILEKK